MRRCEIRSCDWSELVLSADWLHSPVWEVGVTLGRGVTPVTDEEVSPRPEYGAAARVVRHGEQPLPDVKLRNIRTWDILKHCYD